MAFLNQSNKLLIKDKDQNRVLERGERATKQIKLFTFTVNLRSHKNLILFYLLKRGGVPQSTMAKRTDSAPLDAIRLVLKEHAITLQPLVHQVSAMPVEADLEYYFVPAQHMGFYEPYYRPGQPFKNFKLVNYGRPAISLSFFFKHKYTIKRDVALQEVLRHLKEHRDALLNKSLLSVLGLGEQRELQQTDELLRQVREDPDAYQYCLSNYHHYYKYWYCSYRFFEDEAKTQNASYIEHLLKHTQRVEGQVHQRLNVIFVDPYYITRPVPQDNKLIDRELETYPQRIRQGVITLYVKKRS